MLLEAGPQGPPLSLAGVQLRCPEFLAKIYLHPHPGSPCRRWQESPKGFFANSLIFSRIRASPREVKRARFTKKAKACDPSPPSHGSPRSPSPHRTPCHPGPRLQRAVPMVGRGRV